MASVVDFKKISWHDDMNKTDCTRTGKCLPYFVSSFEAQVVAEMKTNHSVLHDFRSRAALAWHSLVLRLRVSRGAKRDMVIEGEKLSPMLTAMSTTVREGVRRGGGALRYGLTNLACGVSACSRLRDDSRLSSPTTESGDALGKC